MNIWTHLLALLALVGVVVLFTIEYLSLPEQQRGIQDETTIDYAMNVLYASCAGCTFLFSVIYHTFGCMSEPVHDCLLKIDLSGITMLLFGSYFPMVSIAKYIQHGLSLSYHDYPMSL
jgi:predicted membrane channel-forming protein YqfA (hemolysin III family)